MLNNMENYRVKGGGLNLMKNYFNQRPQRVKILRSGKSFECKWQTNHEGFPQGSIFGPLFVADLSINVNSNNFRKSNMLMIL